MIYDVMISWYLLPGYVPFCIFLLSLMSPTCDGALSLSTATSTQTHQTSLLDIDQMLPSAGQVWPLNNPDDLHLLTQFRQDEPQGTKNFVSNTETKIVVSNVQPPRLAKMDKREVDISHDSLTSTQPRSCTDSCGSQWERAPASHIEGLQDRINRQLDNESQLWQQTGDEKSSRQHHVQDSAPVLVYKSSHVTKQAGNRKAASMDMPRSQDHVRSTRSGWVGHVGNFHGKTLDSHPHGSDFVYSHTTRTRSPDALTGRGRGLNSAYPRVKDEQGNGGSPWGDGVQTETQMDVDRLCSENNSSLLPHPASCAWYINCSHTPDAVMLTYYQGHVMECPYPQLFSLITGQCEDFNDVTCQDRFEPKSPCEYRANRCRESSHCIPCWVRYASCRGLGEGLNPWVGHEWQPTFVECHKERTVFQGHCRSNAVFSPMTRACETPMSIPSQHGGWKPGCRGRRDGLYPDEFGRCDLYFLCQGQMFRGFHSCEKETKFNPVTSRCEKVENVPFPCGDNVGDNADRTLCRGMEDGHYLDVHGRCNHYFTCTNQTMTGPHVCTRGLFNTFTQSCDVSTESRSILARPCGQAENVCLHREDGAHRLTDPATFAECAQYVVCAQGFVIRSTFACPSGGSLA